MLIENYKYMYPLYMKYSSYINFNCRSRDPTMNLIEFLKSVQSQH